MTLSFDRKHSYEGENHVLTLSVFVDEAYRKNYHICIHFRAPSCNLYFSDDINTPEYGWNSKDGTASFKVPHSLLDSKGVLHAQLVAVNQSGSVVAKSKIYRYYVDQSIENGCYTEIDDHSNTMSLFGIRHDLEKSIDRLNREIDSPVIDFDEEAIRAHKLYRVYPTLADAIQDESLKVGTVFATEGRYRVNDGGMRSYVINTFISAPANPLAVPLFSRVSGESQLDDLTNERKERLAKEWAQMRFGVSETFSDGDNPNFPYGIHWAVPLIDDHVTALDMGLERGIYGENPPYPNDLPKSVYADEDNISAQNSARFQRFIDNLPSWEIDRDENTEEEAEYTDAAWANVPMRKIYFPEGTWGFRDPIIIDKLVTVFGVPRGTTSRGYVRAGINESDDSDAFSRLVFMGRELSFAPVSKGGTVASAFRAQKEGYQVIISPTPGDQKVDRTVSKQILPTSCLEYSFIYAGSRTTFEDLEIDGYDNYYWDYADAVKYNPNYDGPYTKENYAALSATRDRNDPGAAHYIYHTFRKQRGISGITHATPQRDADGKILIVQTIKTNEKTGTQTETNDLSLKWHGWMQVDGCDFYQWSRAGVRACVVDRIKNSTFAYNHFGIEMVSHDLWIMDVYISRGDIGIYSPTHTTTVSNSFIDFMAEFGVSSTRWFDKMEIMDEDSDTPWVKRTGYHFEGLLHVDYDCAIEFCLLGAYAAKTAASKFTIRGKLVNNGLLYCYPCTRIFEKNRLRSLVDERKLTDAVENHSDELNSTTLVWDNETNAWVSAEQPAETETLRYYHQQNAALFAAYDEMKNAHIVLEPTTTGYYGYANVDEQELLNNAESEYKDTESGFAAYTLVHPIETILDPDDEASKAAYQAELMQAYLKYLVGEIADTVNQNRIDNFYRLIGTSHINIEDVWHLHCQANVEVRRTEAKDWDHVDAYGNPERDKNKKRITTFYGFPIAGFNYVRAYRGVVNCLFDKDDYYAIPDPSDPEKKRFLPLTMRKSFYQTRDRIYFEPTNRKLAETITVQNLQYVNDSRLKTPVEEQTENHFITLKHAVTAEGLWVGSLSGYVNFSKQLHPTRQLSSAFEGNGIYTRTYRFDGLSDYSTQLGSSFTVPIYAQDYQEPATTDQDSPVVIAGAVVDGMEIQTTDANAKVALDAVKAYEIIGAATINTSGGVGWITLQPYKRYVGRILPVKF